MLIEIYRARIQTLFRGIKQLMPGHALAVENGKLRLVLLQSLGKAYMTSDFELQDLREVLAGAAAHV